MIIYLLEEIKTTNIKTLVYLIFIVQIYNDSSSFVKNELIQKFLLSSLEEEITDPVFSACAVIIFNLIVKKEMESQNLFSNIINHIRFFSNEFLIFLVWSFIDSVKNPEYDNFIKEIDEYLTSKLDKEDLHNKPYLIYLYNQIRHLMGLKMGQFEFKNQSFQSFYEIMDLNIEEIEFYKGKRFFTKVLKEEISSFLFEEDFRPIRNFITNSNIKVDFLIQKENLVINVCSQEKYEKDWQNNIKLKQIYLNETEILERIEKYTVINISAEEYLNCGAEYKSLDKEKKAKKKFIKKILEKFSKT